MIPSSVPTRKIVSSLGLKEMHLTPSGNEKKCILAYLFLIYVHDLCFIFDEEY
jgi:hypothetical protein